MSKAVPAGWTEDDYLIICSRTCGQVAEGSVQYQGEGVRVIAIPCELCGHSMVAAPVTAEQRHQKGWHAICRQCSAKFIAGREVKFVGTIGRGATELP